MAGSSRLRTRSASELLLTSRMSRPIHPSDDMMVRLRTAQKQARSLISHAQRSFSVLGATVPPVAENCPAFSKRVEPPLFLYLSTQPCAHVALTTDYREQAERSMSHWKVREVGPAETGFTITVTGDQDVPIFTCTYRTEEQANFAAAMINKALERAVSVDKARPLGS